MPEPTPTARDMAAARDAVRSTWSRSREVTEEVVAQAIATARAEGEAAGAEMEREACELIVLRERDTTIDNYHRFDDVAAAIRARRGAPHAQ